MKNSNGGVIYVGKAKKLKNRVLQYFQSGGGHTPKVAAMVSNVADFEYIITDTEFEALVLECSLIKKYRPKYNVLLKDDKSYPFIKVTREEYPRILLARKIEDDGARYFGPYLNSAVIKEAIDLIKKVFMVRSCKRVLPRDIGKGARVLIIILINAVPRVPEKLQVKNTPAFLTTLFRCLKVSMNKLSKA